MLGALPQVPPGVTVGFCRGSGFLSRAIEWFGGGYYSHVTTLMPGQREVIDARLRGGVARRPVSYLKNEAVDWYRLQCSPAQCQAVYEFLTQQLGKRYDVRGIVNFVTGCNRDPNWVRRSAWFCDELAAASWIHAGIARKPFPQIPLFRITPGGSALMFSQLEYSPVRIKI